MMKPVLTTIVVALGAISCAKDVPVYSPQREVVSEVPEIGTFYKEVLSDAERLEIRFYRENPDGMFGGGVTWIRHEASDSSVCLSKEIIGTARLDIFSEYRMSGQRQGYALDTGCDNVLDSCSNVFVHDDGTIVDLAELYCEGMDFSSIETEALGGLDIEEQVRLWHERKGVTE